MGAPLPKEDFDVLARRIDTDGHGKITYSQFARAFKVGCVRDRECMLLVDGIARHCWHLARSSHDIVCVIDVLSAADG